MSEAKLFGKSKSSELRAELEQAKKKLKPQGKVKNVLRKAISNMILNNGEMVHLMPDVIGLMAIDDTELRRLCSQFVAHYALYDVATAVGSLKFYERFATDVNPALRSLAVKTVTSVNVKEFVMLGFPVAKRLLADKEAVVRLAAAFGVARLFQYDLAKTVDLGLVEDVHGMLYDENISVVADALAALQPITELLETLNLQIDFDLAMRLVRLVAGVNEWRQVAFLNAVTAFVPEISEQALQLMEAVLPSLVHESLAVVLGSIKAVVYLSNYVGAAEHVIPLLPKRVGLTLVALLLKPPEIQFLVLRNVILLLLGKRFLLDVDVEQFFWNYDDPIFVKDTKLEIIYLLADESNVDVVFRELEEYATEVDVNMARKAIRAFGNLAIKLDIAAEQSVDILVLLLDAGVPYVVQESIVVLKNVLRKYPGRFEYTVLHVMKHYKIVDEPDAKAAICWMAAQYPSRFANAEQVLGYLVLLFHESPLEVQYALLSAVVKFYVFNPAKGEPLVLNVLRWATEDTDNPDVRDRGFFYWRMITNEANGGPDFQKMTKEIVIDPVLHVLLENETIDPAILEELELNIGSLALIYLKSVEHVFRFSKRKSLAPLPALQPRQLRKLDKLPTRLPTREFARPHMPSLSQRSSSSRVPRTASTASSFASEEEKPGLGRRLTRRASKLIKK